MILSNEDLLQILCVRNLLGHQNSEEIKSLIKVGLNWKEILESASWHNIGQITYHTLKEIPESELSPVEVRDKLKVSYYTTLAQNMATYNELVRILEEIRRRELQTIVLKGAALAKSVYKNIGLRPMIDTDLLIRREDLFDFENLMYDLGYVFRGNRSPEWYRNNYYHMFFINSKNGIQVEIHWHISSKRYPAKIAISDSSFVRDWWMRARPFEIEGTDALVLSPEDSLFLLCMHFLKHRFQTQTGGYRGVFSSRKALIQLCDIYLTMQKFIDIFDWGTFDQQIKKYGATDIIYSTLFLLRYIVGENDRIIDRIPINFNSDNLDEDLIRLIKDRLFYNNYIYSITPLSFFLSVLDGVFKKKFGNLLGALFPHPEMISHIYSVPVSSKKLYLYYPLYIYDFFKRNSDSISVSPSLKETRVINRWIGSD